MKIVKYLSVAALSIAFLFTSCKKDDSSTEGALAYVPATATNVTAIDPRRLMEKADFSEVQKMEFYQAMLGEAGKRKPALMPVLEDPANSGIDLDQKMYISAQVSAEDPETLFTTVFIPLKNAGDFEKMLRDGGAEVSEKGGLKIVNSENGSFLAWNNQLALAGITNGDPSTLDEHISQLFHTEKGNSISSNKDLKKALNGDHDIAGWFTTDDLATHPTAGMGLSMLGIGSEALVGNSIHSYADFEKGRIVGHSDFHINDELGKNFIGRFFKKEVETDFSKILPKENLAFATVLALDLKGIDRFLSERPESQDYADFVLKDYGIKRQDLISAFGGDLLVAGFGKDDLKSSQVLVATSLKNTKKAKEFLQIAVKENRLKEIGEDYYAITSVGNEDFTVTMNKGMGRLLIADDMLIFSTNEALLDKIKNGGFTAPERVDKDVFDHFDGQTLGGWFAFEQIKKVFGGLEGQWFKEMKFKVNGNGADFVLETTDENTNSLKAIFQMMNAAWLQRQSEEQKEL